jgi:hypothetical protein
MFFYQLRVKCSETQKKWEITLMVITCFVKTNLAPARRHGQGPSDTAAAGSAHAGIYLAGPVLQ